MPSKRRKDKDEAPPECSPPDPVLDLTTKEQIIRNLVQPCTPELSNEERAQDLFYEAMGAATPRQMIKLLQEVLALDPDHVDTRLVLLEAADCSPTARIEELRKIVASAIRKLGTRAIEEYKPHFWGFIQTRPYMRARANLAEELLSAGLTEESTREYEEMLELNPGDNQGLRYILLPCYLALNYQKEALKLIKKYPGEVNYNAAFAWGNALLTFLSMEKNGLEIALEAARKQNGHMEAYLLGHRAIPKNTPGGYTLGSQEEAKCFAKSMKDAWDHHPEALAWLALQKADKKRGDRSKK